MRFVERTAMSAVTGQTKPMQLAQCEACDGETFYVCLIGRKQLPHLQCVDCGVTYCDGHTCDTDDEDDDDDAPIPYDTA